VKSVIFAHLPGQESGNALASVLFGDVDASGRLPYTLGKSLDDYGPGAKIKYYPDSIVPQQDFTEGLYIDYRHFDKSNISPRFEFGFGLSYTSFSYSDLKITTLKHKSLFPDPRPQGLTPPTYNSTLPDPSTAVFPPELHKVKNRIYPYINSASDIRKGSYPYPDGYTTRQKPSAAGGAPGGNPSLYDVHITLSFTLKNTGQRTGKEVPQIYVRFPSGVRSQGPNAEEVDFPVRVLRQFEKIELKAGESKVVEINLTRKDLSYWDIWSQNWVMPVDGAFGVDIARSSRDVALSVEW
jgi:beta-glucosidase